MAFHGKPAPHFVLLPAMAQGHMIPLVDTGRLLAIRGVIVTILVTPQNGNKIKRVIDRAVDSGLTIRVSHLKLAYAEAGLPEGCESTDMLPSINEIGRLYTAANMLRGQVKELLQNQDPMPSCIIADAFFPWATDVAQELKIPRLVFHVSSCFALVCSQLLSSLKDMDCDNDYFVLPDMPHRIEMTRAQLRGTPNDTSPLAVKLREVVKKSEEDALGMVVNTFEEIEHDYVEKHTSVTGNKVWCVGPVSLCNKDDSDKAERGNMASFDYHHSCLKWLDSQESGSVVYVCFGSTSDMSTEQMMELGLGLEASNRPFIWVIRNASDGLRKWLLEEEFEERNSGRGLLIKGWAPQMLILSHPSVGGYIMHCGWNSILEGVTAGLPMITWPAYVEQFSNEKFVVNVIKTGVRAGVEVPVMFGRAEEVGVQVKREDVKRVIDELMDEGEGRERRERARKLGEMAKSAVEEGGSSYENMTRLIQDVIMYKAKHGD